MSLVKQFDYKGVYVVECPFCKSTDKEAVCSVRYGHVLGLVFCTLWKCKKCGNYFIEIQEPVMWIRENEREEPIHRYSIYVGDLDELLKIVANEVLKGIELDMYPDPEILNPFQWGCNCRELQEKIQKIVNEELAKIERQEEPEEFEEEY